MFDIERWKDLPDQAYLRAARARYLGRCGTRFSRFSHDTLQSSSSAILAWASPRHVYSIDHSTLGGNQQERALRLCVDLSRLYCKDLVKSSDYDILLCTWTQFAPHIPYVRKAVHSLSPILEQHVSHLYIWNNANCTGRWEINPKTKETIPSVASMCLVSNTPCKMRYGYSL